MSDLNHIISVQPALCPACQERKTHFVFTDNGACCADCARGTKVNWKEISKEVSAALFVKPNPPQPAPKPSIPTVILRKSVNRVERAFLALGRLA